MLVKFLRKTVQGYWKNSHSKFENILLLHQQHHSKFQIFHKTLWGLCIRKVFSKLADVAHCWGMRWGILQTRACSTVGEYHRYIERYSVLWGISTVLWRIFSTVDGVHKHFGYYLQCLWFSSASLNMLIMSLHSTDCIPLKYWMDFTKFQSYWLFQSNKHFLWFLTHFSMPRYFACKCPESAFS